MSGETVAQRVRVSLDVVVQLLFVMMAVSRAKEPPIETPGAGTAGSCGGRDSNQSMKAGA